MGPDQECNIALRFDKSCDHRRYNLPTATSNEIAVILPGSEDQPQELFTLPHLFLPDSYWTPGFLLDFTRTPANFILADHHTNLVSQSYWSPSKFLLELLGIADS